VFVDIVVTLPLGLKLQIDDQISGITFEDEAAEQPFEQPWLSFPSLLTFSS